MNESATSPVVELAGLEKSFRTSKGVVHAVRGVDVSIRAGEIVALLGPNGAGKSTTIDMLLGLTDPDDGTVSVLGGRPDEAIEAGGMGVMLQTGSLIRDLSVRELVMVVASLYPTPLDVDEVLRLVGLEALADRRTQKLSGGESQRVRFALALVCDPQLLVLDEPTVAMDVEGRHAFWQAMRAFAARGRTILFATHQLEEADAYADRAVVMAEGRVVADGPTNEIKATVGLRTIRATLPDVPLDELSLLPGVQSADRHGDSVVLRCTDADTALRALLDVFPEARGIEVASAGLEHAFLELTRVNGKAVV
jgi:ABC-2 type transport system ATP-binding protein